MPEPLRYDLEADVTAALGALQLQVIKLGAENRVLKQRLRELEPETPESKAESKGRRNGHKPVPAGSGSPSDGQAGVP